MEHVLFGAGQTIFSQGDTSDLVYRITAGSVDIVVSGSDGAEKRIASLGPDEVFGEMGIIDPAPRSATAIAREATSCEVMSAADVIDLMSTDPAQVMDLMRALILRLRTANRKLAARAPLSVPKRPGSN